jgi:hypothetical protein
MGTPILTSLRQFLTLSGVADADLPHPDHTPLQDAFHTVIRLTSANPRFSSDPAPLERAQKGMHYLRMLEQSFNGPAAADHARRGMA